MPRDHPRPLRHRHRWLPLLLLLSVAGCQGTVAPDSDERLLQLSQQSLAQQAEQNEQIARQSQAVIDASGDLVEADAQARQELIEVHHDLQTERQGLDLQRADLVAEQRQIAATRYRDPLIARTLETLGWIAVALLPLVLAWQLLRQNGSAWDGDAAVTELLLQELTAAPTLLLQAASPTAEPLRGLPGPESVPVAPVLVVLEGTHDIEFLRRISRVLHAADPTVPDLGVLEQAQRLVFVPAGGDQAADWVPRLSHRVGRSFQLYDREQGAQTEQRIALVQALNAQPGCRAYLTRKRSLENYLHPEAISAARGLTVVIDDELCVAEAVVVAELGAATWDRLSPRSRRRLRQQAKRWLNTDAVDRMTLDRLQERDPQGELLGWLREIEALVIGP